MSYVIIPVILLSKDVEQKVHSSTGPDSLELPKTAQTINNTTTRTSSKGHTILKP